MRHSSGENEPFYDLGKGGKNEERAIVGRLRGVRIVLFFS